MRQTLQVVNGSIVSASAIPAEEDETDAIVRLNRAAVGRCG
jgi:hypothetical protein